MSRSASNEYEGARAMSKTKAYDELSDEAVNELEAALEADLNSRSDRLPDSDETSEDSKDAKASFDETSHPASTEVDFSFEDFERQLSETADEFRADDVMTTRTMMLPRQAPKAVRRAPATSSPNAHRRQAPRRRRQMPGHRHPIRHRGE